jgi:hypothetical protein
MKQTRQRIAVWLTSTFVVLMTLGCGTGMAASAPDYSLTPGYISPSPYVIIVTTNPDYQYAQATINAGQSQLAELSSRATEESLKIAQTENAADLSTQENNQRQQVELDLQATAISLNMAHAAATEDTLKQQTKAARNVAIEAQKIAAVVTQAAFLVKVTQTAQAHAFLEAQVQQTGEAAAAATAYPLTATPQAATQTALLMQQYERERQNFVNQIVVPLIPIVAAILFILVIILVIVLMDRQLIPIPWARPSNGYINTNPSVMIDGKITERGFPTDNTPSDFTPENWPLLPCEKLVSVEVVNPDEPLVAPWIDEVRQQSPTQGG